MTGLSSFQEWATHHNADFSNIKFDVVDGVRGGITKKNISTNEDLLSVPLYLLITMEVVEKSYIGAIFRELQLHTSDPWAPFYLYIIRETYCDTASDKREYKVIGPSGEEVNFKPYFQTLPKIIGTPLSWSEEEFKLLKGSNLYDGVCTIKTSLLNTFNSLVPVLLNKYPSIFDSNIFTWENFIWAYEIFWSRALSVEAPWHNSQGKQYLQSKHVLSNQPDDEEENESEDAGTNKRIAALVPVVDLLNHSPTSKVTFYTDMSTNRFKLVSRDDINSGVQAFNNYGLRNNEKLLLNYGFLLDNNSIDYFYLKLGWSNNDELHKKRLLTLLKSKNLKSQHYLVRGDVPIDNNLLLSLRIRLMSDNEFYIYNSYGGPEYTIKYSDKVSGAISMPNECQTLSLLHTMLKQRMAKFEISIEEDFKLLSDSSSLSLNSLHAIKYRLGQKEILKSSIILIEELQESLFSYSQSNNLLKETTLPATIPQDYLAWLDTTTSTKKFTHSIMCEHMPYLICDDDIPKNEAIYSINKDYIINEYTLMNDNILSQFQCPNIESLKLLFSDNVSEDLFITYLLMENMCDINSKWKLYYSAVTKEYLSHLPIFYSKEELGELEGTNAINIIEEVLQEYSEECSQLLIFIKEHGNFNDSNHNWESFLKSRILVECYGTKIPHLNTLSIIPILTSPIQHPNLPLPVYYNYNSITQEVEYCSELYLHKGNCITFRRDSDNLLDNSSIFAFSGSCIENNPLDGYSLCIDIPQDNLYRLRKIIIEKEGFQVEQHFLSNQSIPTGLLFVLKIASINKIQLENFKELSIEDKIVFKKDLIKDVELIEQTIELLESMLETFSSSLEEDSLLFTKYFDLSSKMQRIIKYRKQQKNIILNTISNLKLYNKQ